MADKELQDHQKAEIDLYNKVFNAVEACIAEWDLTHFQVTGCLQRVIHNLQVDADFQEEDADDDKTFE